MMNKAPACPAGSRPASDAKSDSGRHPDVPGAGQGGQHATAAGGDERPGQHGGASHVHLRDRQQAAGVRERHQVASGPCWPRILLWLITDPSVGCCCGHRQLHVGNRVLRCGAAKCRQDAYVQRCASCRGRCRVKTACCQALSVRFLCAQPSKAKRKLRQRKQLCQCIRGIVREAVGSANASSAYSAAEYRAGNSGSSGPLTWC